MVWPAQFMTEQIIKNDVFLGCSLLRKTLRAIFVFVVKKPFGYCFHDAAVLRLDQ